jgi:serine/threonine protein kinase
VTTQALHPDHLQPGHTVGPWRIVQELGRGGFSRVFKVEREGVFYSLKMALRPLSLFREELSEDEYVEEKSAYRRLAREAAALFTYSSHPNLLRVYAMDFWPDPTRGYPFLVTDYVDGDDWHRWRWRKPRHAAELVDTFGDVVRTVGVLHARGVYHRDLKAENLLIRRADGQALPHRLRHRAPAGDPHEDHGTARGHPAPGASRAPGLHAHRGVEAP